VALYGMAFTPNGKETFCKEILIPPLVAVTSLKRSNGDTDEVLSRHDYADSLPVTYTNDAMAAQIWVDRHIGHRSSADSSSRSISVVGWDMESTPSLPWRKTMYSGPSTVQLSVVDAALVLQIAREDIGPYWENLPFLSDILSNPSILKVGVGLDQDILDLIRWPHGKEGQDPKAIWGPVVGRLDIGGIGASYGYTKSLKLLAQDICGVELEKSRKIAMSNWAASSPPQLSDKQIAYAARDAWASAAIIHELARRDPDQFSTEVLMTRVLEGEMPIELLNTNSLARKEAKTKLKMILTDKDGNKVDRKSLSIDQLEDASKLEAIMKKLAPPKPFLFELMDT